jgi:DNA-binding MarR family transcriptional regulator
MLRRMTDARRALLRKLENAEAFPLVALQALRELRADLDLVEAQALFRARELGASLEDIAEALEITRQGVSYRLKALAGTGHDEGAPAEDEIVDVREPDTRSARGD